MSDLRTSDSSSSVSMHPSEHKTARKLQDDVHATRGSAIRESLISQAVTDGSHSAAQSNYRQLFVDLHEVQIVDGSNSSRFEHDLWRINSGLGSSGIHVEQPADSSSASKNSGSQIKLTQNSGGQTVELTATYLSAGQGRDAQVITDQSNNVVEDGISYYKQASNGNEHLYGFGSTKKLPPNALFEDTSLTDANMSQALARLNIMHSMGIKTVVVAADEGYLSNLKEYAAAAQALKPPMSIMWDISANGSASDDKNSLVWLHPNDTDAARNIFDELLSGYPTDDPAHPYPPTNKDALDYVVQQLSAIPGTKGFYAADDSNISDTHAGAKAVAAYLTDIKANEANSDLQLMVGSFGAQQRAIYQKALRGLGTVGNEEYPVYKPTDDRSFDRLNDQGLPYGDQNNSSAFESDSPSAVEQSIRATQKGSSENDEPTNLILQAFNWGPEYQATTYPSFADQAGLRNLALANSHVQNLYWYWMPGTDSGSKSTQNIATLAAAINAPLANSAYWNTAGT